MIGDSTLQGYLLFCFLKGCKVAIACGGVFVAYKYWRCVGLKSLVTWLLLRTLLCFALLQFTTLDSFDLHGWLLHAKWIVENGCVPGRAFRSPYHLGFEYLNALVIVLWRSEFAIAALFVVCEFAGVVLMKKTLAELFGECVAMRSLIMFETSAITFDAALGTQDESIILLGVAMILRMLVYGGTAWRLFVSVFFTFCVSKILAPFYFACLCLTRRWKGLSVLLAAISLYWSLTLVIGINPFDIRFGRTLGIDAVGDEILTGLKVESVSIWWYIPSISPKFMYLPMLLGFVVIFGCFIKDIFYGPKDCKLRAAIYCTALLGGCFQFFYPYFYGCYCIPFLPFVFCTLFAVADRKWKVAALVTFWGVAYGGIFPGAERWDVYRTVVWCFYAICHWYIMWYIFQSYMNQRNRVNGEFLLST